MGYSDEEGQEVMKELMKTPCSGCAGRLRRKKISQVFEKEA